MHVKIATVAVIYHSVSDHRSMGRIASTHTMKVFLDTYSRKKRSEEELKVVEREAKDSVKFCDQQLVQINVGIENLRAAEPNTRGEGQRVQLMQRRSKVSSLRERLVKTRDRIISGECGVTPDASLQSQSEKVGESGGEGERPVDEGAEEADDVWDEEEYLVGRASEFDSALGGSLGDSDEEL